MAHLDFFPPDDQLSRCLLIAHKSLAKLSQICPKYASGDFYFAKKVGDYEAAISFQVWALIFYAFVNLPKLCGLFMFSSSFFLTFSETCRRKYFVSKCTFSLRRIIPSKVSFFADCRLVRWRFCWFFAWPGFAAMNLAFPFLLFISPTCLITPNCRKTFIHCRCKSTGEMKFHCPLTDFCFLCEMVMSMGFFDKSSKAWGF